MHEKTTNAKIIKSIILSIIAIIVCFALCIALRNYLINKKRKAKIREIEVVLAELTNMQKLPVEITQNLVDLKTKVWALKDNCENHLSESPNKELFAEASNKFETQFYNSTKVLTIFKDKINNLIAASDMGDKNFYYTYNYTLSIGTKINLSEVIGGIDEIIGKLNLLTEKIGRAQAGRSVIDGLLLESKQITITIPEYTQFPPNSDKMLSGVVSSSVGMIFFVTSHSEVIKQIKANKTYTGLFIPSDYPVSITRGYPAFSTIDLRKIFESKDSDLRDVYALVKDVNSIWEKLSSNRPEKKNSEDANIDRLKHVFGEAFSVLKDEVYSDSNKIFYNRPKDGHIIVELGSFGAHTCNYSYYIFDANKKLSRKFGVNERTFIDIPGDYLFHGLSDN